MVNMKKTTEVSYCNNSIRLYVILYCDIQMFVVPKVIWTCTSSSEEKCSSYKKYNNGVYGFIYSLLKLIQLYQIWLLFHFQEEEKTGNRKFLRIAQKLRKLIFYGTIRALKLAFKTFLKVHISREIYSVKHMNSIIIFYFLNFFLIISLFQICNIFC